MLLLAWLEPRCRRGAYFWVHLSVPLFFRTIFLALDGTRAAERSMALVSAIANLYLCAVPIAGLMVLPPGLGRLPEVTFLKLRPRMANTQTPLGWFFFAPMRESKLRCMLPSSSGKLSGIELLTPALGMAGGFAANMTEDIPNCPSVDFEA